MKNDLGVVTAMYIYLYIVYIYNTYIDIYKYNIPTLNNPDFNPFMPTVAFNIFCPRDCVSRHNGGTAGAPLKPLRDDSALRWA